jgi:hypothetical protein
MAEIERVHAVPPEQLWSTYVLGRKPVIITDLLEGMPSRSVAQTIAAFRDLSVAHEHGAGPLTLRDIHEREAAGVHALDLPIEHVRPARGLFDLVDRLKTPLDRRLDELGRGPARADCALMFYGFHEATPCHTDGWVTQSVSAQLAGTKEWFLAPPQLVAPLGPYGSTILMDPMKLTREQRQTLAELIGGYSFTLQPGEALYWPHQWLHGTYYHEPSIATVLHFGRDLFSVFVSREVHRGFLRHAILEKLYPASAIEQRHWNDFIALHDACRHAHANPAARFHAIEDVLRQVYASCYPDQPLARLAFDFESIRALDEQACISFYEGSLERNREAWVETTQQPLFDWWRAS